MPKHLDIDPLDPIPAVWTDALQEVLSGLTSFLVRVKPGTSTVLQVPASPDNGQVGMIVRGRWRYITAPVEAASPGGAKRTLDVHVTASENVFVSGNPGLVDDTVHAFGLAITEHDAVPSGAALTRKVAEALWSGSAFLLVTPFVGGATQDAPPSVPVGAYVDTAGPAVDSADGRLLIADGRALPRASYPELFAALGATSSPYGLPDASSFSLPDRRRKVHVPSSAGRPPGETGGAETVKLSGAQSGVNGNGTASGSHSHAASTGDNFAMHSITNPFTFVQRAAANDPTSEPLTNAPRTANQAVTVALNNLDATSAHENMPPFLIGTTLIRVR